MHLQKNISGFMPKLRHEIDKEEIKTHVFVI